MSYDFKFEDGSDLTIPADWRDVLERVYERIEPAAFEQRLRFLVSKYIEHRAMPSKFDGIVMDDVDDDSRFDDDRYYAEPWQGPAPTEAQIGYQVVYRILRLGIMQKVMDRHAAETGTKPTRIVSVEEFLSEYTNGDGTD